MDQMKLVERWLMTFDFDITLGLQFKTMAKHMTQEEIDQLIKDSMFSDSELKESKLPAPGDDPYAYNQEQFESYQESMPNRSAVPRKQKPVEQSYGYGAEEFESYQESRGSKVPVSKANTGAKSNQVQTQPAKSKKLEEIRQESSPAYAKKSGTSKQNFSNSRQKPRPKTGISFYPPKQAPPPSSAKQILPYNYTRMQDREKELLVTSLSEQTRTLKEEIRRKQQQFSKLQKAYKQLLQQKSQQAPSVREITLQKQLSSLQSRHDKLQQLVRMQKDKQVFKLSKTSQGFVASEQASQREEQLLQIIDQLKERLVSTDTELRTLQKKVSQGEDYIQELRRKMRRVEQLQFKMEKMAGEAENDREFIRQLRDRNSRLQQQLADVQKEKRLLEVQATRLQIGQATQGDILAQLKEARREKDMLQSRLRDLTLNLTNLSRKGGQWQGIEDSGQLLRP